MAKKVAESEKIFEVSSLTRKTFSIGRKKLGAVLLIFFFLAAYGPASETFGRWVTLNWFFERVSKFVGLLVGVICQALVILICSSRSSTLDLKAKLKTVSTRLPLLAQYSVAVLVYMFLVWIPIVLVLAPIGYGVVRATSIDKTVVMYAGMSLGICLVYSYAGSRLFCALPAIVFESKMSRDAFRLSGNMTRPYFWRLLGLYLALTAPAMILAFVNTSMTGGLPASRSVLLGIVQSILYSVTQIFTAGLAANLYQAVKGR